MGGMTSGTAKLALAAQFSPTVNRLKTMGISPVADADHRVSLIGIAESYLFVSFGSLSQTFHLSSNTNSPKPSRSGQ